MKAQKHKSQPVRYKIRKIIAVIAHRTTRVFGHIIFNVMHSHVVNVIRITEVTEKRANAPKQIPVHKFIFLKEFSVAETMQHQPKGAFKVEL